MLTRLAVLIALVAGAGAFSPSAPIAAPSSPCSGTFVSQRSTYFALGASLEGGCGLIRGRAPLALRMSDKDGTIGKVVSDVGLPRLRAPLISPRGGISHGIVSSIRERGVLRFMGGLSLGFLLVSSSSSLGDVLSPCTAPRENQRVCIAHGRAPTLSMRLHSITSKPQANLNPSPSHNQMRTRIKPTNQNSTKTTPRKPG